MNTSFYKRLLLAPLLLLPAACAQWPGPVGGGAAETFGPRPVCGPEVQHGARHALDHRLGCQLDRLASLRLAGAATLLPGRVERAQTQADRTVRELTGRLYGDAQYDTEILAAMLDEIERMMAAAREGDATPAPMAGDAAMADADAALLALVGRLGCHAQFHTGSSELDPRFAALLGELGRHMASRPELAVTVTGHTDDVGSEASNDLLAADRAESVRSTIVAAGVDPARITVVAAGERSPLFRATSPAMRLANRRVELLVHSGERQLAGPAACAVSVAAPQ